MFENAGFYMMVHLHRVIDQVITLPDLFVLWHDNTHVVAHFGQRFGKGAGYVCKSSGFCKGHYLSGGNQYL